MYFDNTMFEGTTTWNIVGITPYRNFAKHTILRYTVSPVGSEKKHTHPMTKSSPKRLMLHWRKRRLTGTMIYSCHPSSKACEKSGNKFTGIAIPICMSYRLDSSLCLFFWCGKFKDLTWIHVRSFLLPNSKQIKERRFSNVIAEYWIKKYTEVIQDGD